MPVWLQDLGFWLQARLDLMPPLVLSLAIAGWDLKSRRIPNFLTFGGALAGLGFQLGFNGLPGLWDGLGGLALGFFLLIGPYLMGGMGAGDVKATAALGAWLGLRRAFFLFLAMGIFGGVMIIAVLLWQGRLWAEVRRGWNFLLNWVLCRPHQRPGEEAAKTKGATIPYGAAMALGMAYLWWRGI